MAGSLHLSVCHPRWSLALHFTYFLHSTGQSDLLDHLFNSTSSVSPTRAQLPKGHRSICPVYCGMHAPAPILLEQYLAGTPGKYTPDDE